MDEYMERCSHVWVDGFVDFGVSYTRAKTVQELLLFRHAKLLSFDVKFQKPEYCTICFLQRYANSDGKWAYLKYWQKELRLNRELVSSYYRQLRESATPMNYYDYVLFREEQAKLVGEKFDYKTRLPDHSEGPTQ